MSGNRDSIADIGDGGGGSTTDNSDEPATGEDEDPQTVEGPGGIEVEVVDGQETGQDAQTPDPGDEDGGSTVPSPEPEPEPTPEPAAAEPEPAPEPEPEPEPAPAAEPEADESSDDGSLDDILAMLK